MIEFIMKALNLSNKSHSCSLIILTASLVFATYLPILNNGFVWDDTHNFIENLNYRGLSLSHLYWMFTTFHDANYHPLCWLTLGFDFILWGMNPAGYHLTNLMLHILNAVLFYFLILAFLRRTGLADPSVHKIGVRLSAVIGTLFFAIHPLRTESVAWVSTRGDVLCGFFYMITILAYLRMTDTEDDEDRKKWYIFSLAAFFLSLLSRAWGVTLPLILLILDSYPLRRLIWKGRITGMHKKIILEKIPFGLLSIGSTILSLIAKKGSMLTIDQHDMLDRFIQATYGLCFYILKTVVPMRLSPYYALNKTFNPLELKYILCTLSVLAVTIGLIAMRHRWPWAITAWVCYVVIVSPLLGFVQSGPQIVADRYTYISCLPFGVLAGAGMLRLWIAQHKKRLISKTFISAVSSILVCLIALSTLSYHQTRIWHDNYKFWNHVIQLDPDNYIAYNNRGILFKEGKGNLTLALADYNTAIELNAEYTGAYYNRGILLEEQGDLDGAIRDYTSVIRLDPNHAKAFNNRGGLLRKKGDLTGAIADFNTAIRLNPSSPEAYANRGALLQNQNDIKKAVKDFTKALEVAPANWPFQEQVEQTLNNIQARIKGQDNQIDFR
jgi:tetratricopeptide (TPR) repeat protein